MIQSIKNLSNRINNICARAVIDLIAQSDDKGRIFLGVSGKADDEKADVEHLQQYGFRSMPMVGSKGIWIAYGGDTDNISVICADNKNFGQYDLNEGDVMIYNQNGTRTLYQGDAVITEIAEGGSHTVNIGGNSLEMTNDHFKITIGGAVYEFTADKAEFAKDLDVTGKIDASADITGADCISGGISGKNHVHEGNLGNPTSPPTP